MQACQSLKRQADRDKCLESAIKAVSPKPAAEAPVAPLPTAKEAAQARIAKALEASRAVQSVANSGTSFLQYQSYIPPFAIALDQFKAVAQLPEEKDAAMLLADALDAYTDAATYWQLDNRFYSYENNRIGFPDAQPAALAGTVDIVLRYKVPLQRADMFGFQKGAPLSTALSTIWEYAQDKTNAAQDAINKIGKPTEAARAQPDATPQQIAAAKRLATSENDNPWQMIVTSGFVGGTYSAPSYSAPRLSNSVAGVKVSAYGYRDGWARVSPKGQTEQWIPINQLSNVE
ncbi:hypothetical protein PQR02_04920 [Paraburkholderia sediminicola]|uniref:Uncharacterized protein n=1 Tax=Paraburkholderia rhynchosiae TaxID=487049 RepID=A0ACC7N957_9BURK